jgi:2-phospho-L-lactate guanylyltransferase
MTCRIVIPVRPPKEGKTRLASVLAPKSREALVRRMFCHVLGVAVASVPPSQVYVVTHSPLLRSLTTGVGAWGVHEEQTGLNLALEQVARSCGPELPLLALSADLPLLVTADIAAMFALLEQADVVAATDQAHSGTNALLMRRPGLIRYAFGEDSLARHHSAAVAAGLRVAIIDRPNLAADLDLPSQGSLLQAAFGASSAVRQTTLVAAH